MESQSSLVWTQCRVELHTVSAIDLDLALVIFPGDSELDDPLGNGGDLESGLVLGILLEEGRVLECRSKLCGQTQYSITCAYAISEPAEAHLCTPARTLARMEG